MVLDLDNLDNRRLSAVTAKVDKDFNEMTFEDFCKGIGGEEVPREAQGVLEFNTPSGVQYSAEAEYTTGHASSPGGRRPVELNTQQQRRAPVSQTILILGNTLVAPGGRCPVEFKTL
jgi:hypothetical protein